ncbi:MAG: hypothetical protein IPK00_10500 [Deltaproteobacteria bacterium]|nr:hypothetical protein [Deltaproteobacteria bacterium]
MPVLDAGSAVLLAAIPELNQRWYEEIYRPYSEEAQDLVSLYDPDGGALSRFMTAELGPFFERNEPKIILGDLTLPFSDEFLDWLEESRSMQRSLFPGSGAALTIPVRLEGVPSKVKGSEGVFVTRRDLILECPSSVQTFEYREGRARSIFLDA